MTILPCGCVLAVISGSDEHGCRLARIDWCRDHAQAAETKAILGEFDGNTERSAKDKARLVVDEVDACRDHLNTMGTDLVNLQASHDRLLMAVAALTKLPNWQNRLGSWTDVIDAVQDIAIAAVPKE